MLDNNLFDIFIFCGGKCGGTTLANTFSKNGFKTTHFHSFTCKGLFESNIEFNDLLKVLEKSSKNKKIYLIDSYRTPIERKISSFFQNINSYLPNYSILSIEYIINLFNTQYLNELENYHPINESMTYYEVPLFKTFDFGKRYNIVEKDNQIFIKLLFKDIKKCNEILCEIFGKNIIIHSDNLTENKNVGELYTLFKSKYRVPIAYLENIATNDEQFKIYNTLEEQEEYIKYWLNNSFSD